MEFRELLRALSDRLVADAQRIRFLSPAARAEEKALLAQLGSDQPSIRWQAAEALATREYLGARAVVALGAALADPDPILRWQVARVLALGGTPATKDALSRALASENPVVQAAAADAIGLAPADPDLARGLVNALASPAPRVRQSAAEALAARPAASALPALSGLLESDADFLVRRAAAAALGALEDGAAREPLTACAEDGQEHPLVQEAAKRALASLANSGKDAN